MLRTILVMVALAGIAACSKNAGGAQPFEATNEPEEFLVVPAKPLVIPTTLTLPQPTPGGTNRADNGDIRMAPEPG